MLGVENGTSPAMVSKQFIILSMKSVINMNQLLYYTGFIILLFLSWNPPLLDETV